MLTTKLEVSPRPILPIETRVASPVELRPIEPGDRGEVARIVYEAFGAIHDRHRFARDFPTLEAAVQLTSDFIAHPEIGASSPRSTAGSWDRISSTSVDPSAA
jgi:hypothetical protein